MADNIKVIFKRVFVKNDEDWFGDGEFYFIASVDGTPVASATQTFPAVEGRWIDLPQPQWSHVVDAAGKTEIRVRFKGKEQDLIWDDDLGPEMVYTLRPPWSQARNYNYETDDYRLEWSVELLVEGSYGMHPPDTVFACRSTAGATVCNTVSGGVLSARMEIHPVIPMPSDVPTPVGATPIFPPRPVFPPGTSPAKYNPNNVGHPAIQPGDPINIIHNPCVIPILSPPPPASAPAAGAPPVADATNAAQIEFTYYRPDSLDFADHDPRLEWTAVAVSGGAAVGFVGPALGTKVLVYGITAGEVRLEVRFRGALFAEYRALVGAVKQIPCRFNIMNGPTARSRPRATPANVRDHLAIANRFLRQMAVELVLDTNPSVTNGAVATTIPGIFRIACSAGTTRNVPVTGFMTATKLNYRPNVMNFAYIHSDVSGNLGAADAYPASGAGATITDNGRPTPSWNIPSGVDPDGAAAPVTMTLLAARLRPGFPTLVSMYVTDTGNGDPANINAMQTYAGTIAHEFGHNLNLGHRVDSPTSPFNDGVNHPPGENVMHWNNPTNLAQDFDIIQARAARQSPIVPP